jgi:predicted Zn-dependent protease
LYVEAGDLNQGLELLGKATALAPNAAPIKLNYARALVKAGQNTVARPQLESLTKLPPESAVRQEAEKILSTL